MRQHEKMPKLLPVLLLLKTATVEENNNIQYILHINIHQKKEILTVNIAKLIEAHRIYTCRNVLKAGNT